METVDAHDRQLIESALSSDAFSDSLKVQLASFFCSYDANEMPNPGDLNSLLNSIAKYQTLIKLYYWIYPLSMPMETSFSSVEGDFCE